MDARSHYDRIAARYEEQWARGWRARLRAHEREAVYAMLAPHRGGRILDAGCGSGFDAVPLAHLGYVVEGVDISPRMVEEARRRGLNASVADIETLELGRTFPKILCCGALEFCARPRMALEALVRHLEVNGSLVVLLPRKSLVGLAYRLFHASHRVRVTLFDVDSITAWLTDAGLRIEQVRLPTPFTAVVSASRRRSQED